MAIDPSPGTSSELAREDSSSAPSAALTFEALREALRQELAVFAEHALAEALARDRKQLAAELCGAHLLPRGESPRGEVEQSAPETVQSDRSVTSTRCPSVIEQSPGGALPVMEQPGVSPSAVLRYRCPTVNAGADFDDVDEHELMFARRHYRNHNAAEELRNMELDAAVHLAASTRQSVASVAETRKSIKSVVPVGGSSSYSSSLPPIHLKEVPREAEGFGPFCHTGGGSDSKPAERSLGRCGGMVRLQQAVFIAVTHPRFDYGVGTLIFVNAACIGAQTDYSAQNVGTHETQVYDVLEWLFCISFSAELFARVVAYNTLFFVMPGRLWNVFDCALVGTQIAEQVMTSGGGNFSAMRILRILRVIRIVRLVRVLRLIGELRTIVICVAGSMRSLFWTVVLLLVMIYIVAVYLTQVVSDFRLEQGDTPEVADVLYYFGSLGRSVLSLYQAMSGGISWDEAVSPLMTNISPLLGVLFALYIAFALLAIMNVVTGVFVETALETAKNDKEVSLVHHTREVFNVGDQDRSGTLTWDEFEGQVESREMQDLFRLVGIDTSEARALFQLLDLEESGTISFDDFLNGCLRLRGTAKSIDLMTVMYETRRLARNQFRQVKAVQKSVKQLRDQIGHHLVDLR